LAEPPLIAGEMPPTETAVRRDLVTGEAEATTDLPVTRARADEDLTAKAPDAGFGRESEDAISQC